MTTLNFKNPFLLESLHKLLLTLFQSVTPAIDFFTSFIVNACQVLFQNTAKKSSNNQMYVNILINF